MLLFIIIIVNVYFLIIILIVSTLTTRILFVQIKRSFTLAVSVWFTHKKEQWGSRGAEKNDPQGGLNILGCKCSNELRKETRYK